MLNARASISCALILISWSIGCTDKEATASPSAVPTREVSVGGSTYNAAEVDLQLVELGLFYRDPNGKRLGRFETLRDSLGSSNRKLLFATNAGIFNPDFTPCGLHIENGIELAPLNLGDGVGNFYIKPNGVFMIDDHGARIVDAASYSAVTSTVHLATQSGPLLVMDGKINSKLSASSTSKRIRSGVGVVDAQHVIFVISRNPVTFYEVAAVFRDQLHCPHALYLDGEISAFYAPQANANGTLHEYAGILGITSKR